MTPNLTPFYQELARRAIILGNLGHCELAAALLTAADVAGELKPAGLEAAVIAWRSYRGVSALNPSGVPNEALFSAGMAHLDRYLNSEPAEVPRGCPHPELPDPWPNMLVEVEIPLPPDMKLKPVRRRFRIDSVAIEPAGVWVLGTEGSSVLWSTVAVRVVCSSQGAKLWWSAE